MALIIQAATVSIFVMRGKLDAGPCWQQATKRGTGHCRYLDTRHPPDARDPSAQSESFNCAEVRETNLSVYRQDLVSEAGQRTDGRCGVDPPWVQWVNRPDIRSLLRTPDPTTGKRDPCRPTPSR